MGVKLKALMRACQKEHGPGSFRSASDTRAISVFRIPTGFFALDYAMGGGIPIGRTSMVYGRRSSGKSSLLAKIVANAQKMCRKCYGPCLFEEREVPVMVVRRDPGTGKVVEVKEKKKKQVPYECINKCRYAPKDEEGKEGKTKAWPGRMSITWIDAEGTFDVPFYTFMGVDCDDVNLVVTDYGEEAVDIADAAIRTGEVDLLICDTIAHLTPKKERENSTEENAQPGLQARLVNKAMRIWTSSLNQLEAEGHLDCTIILVNQIRQKLGTMFPTYTKPGGMGQDFATSLDLQLWQKEFKFDTTGRALWMSTRFAVEKNKTFVPKMEGEYRMCLTQHPGRNPGDSWDDEVVFESAQNNGFISKKDGKLMVMDKKFETEDDIKKELFKRGDLFNTLRATVLDLVTGRPSDGQIAEKKKKDD
jgi:RecA/RadA recombinase